MQRGITNQEFFRQHMVQSRPLYIVEAARIMRRDEKKVRAMMLNGTIPYIKQGKGRYLLIEDIRRILRQEAEAAKVVEERRGRPKKAADASHLNPRIQELMRLRKGLPGRQV